MIDVSNFEIVPIDLDSPIGEFGREARRYIESHKWCRRVYDVHRAPNEHALVFLVRFDPLTMTADSEVWVVSGDLPLCYMDTNGYGLDDVLYKMLVAYSVCTSNLIEDILKNKSIKDDLQLAQHGTFTLISSKPEAKECIPLMTSLANSLISQQHLFNKLSSFAQEDLHHIHNIGNKWLIDRNFKPFILND